MMSKEIFWGLTYGLLIGKIVFGVGSTEISYTTANLGSNQWQYTYQVTNLTLSTPIDEFTIWFDHSLYRNLLISTLNPLANKWGEIIWQPEVGLGNGGYDALAASWGIPACQTESGFCVRFDWLGTGTPGAQFYEVINPSDFSRIDSGFTIPEPAMITLIILGSFFFRKQK
jgi:hypothetical protein